MPSRRLRLGLAIAAALAACGVVLAPAGARAYWRLRADNPVRRGVRLAGELGCFSCHGDLGSGGVPDPGLGGKTVPGWSGGVWMMYVRDAAEVREFIADGVSKRRAASESARDERAKAAIRMPAYESAAAGAQIDALTAAFLVLSGMKRPDEDTPEGRGLAVASTYRCLSCHAPGGSGGLPNPGSFTGFVPGWYGADFHDLVRGRAEFESWVRTGSIPRLESNAAASWFLRRQRLRMPAYRDLPPEEMDALWSYAEWLGRTRGGLDAPTRSF